MKNILKFCAVALLLLSVVAVPVFGVHYYDSESIFSENAFYTNRQFGKGTSVYLEFEEPDESDEDATPLEVTDAVIKSAVDILKDRFSAVGYSDVVVEAVDGKDQIRVDVAQTSFIDSVVGELCAVGDWSFVNSTQSTVMDQSMVKDAHVAVANGSYYVTIEFTESGAKQFESNCYSIALSSGSIYLMIDGAFTSYVNLSDATFGDTFTFGTFEYAAASKVAANIRSGALPAAMKIASTEPLEPVASVAIRTVVPVAFAVVYLAILLILVIKGRLVGLFAAGAVLADICVLLTALANKMFIVDYPTLIALCVLLILAGVFHVYTVIPYGKALKSKKSILGVYQSASHRNNVLTIWIHAVLLVVAVICWISGARGNFFYVVMITILSAVTNAVTYFVFILSPTATLRDVQENK